ncbi:MAG: type II secretion system major pseudopilin GspG [Planctomycetes bacterium]|nr:type II secretion system major pseudopilin GspG [Planctomycetota bacterium]
MKCKKHRRKAFTLVELLVVIVILSMLAAFAAPKFFQYIGKSRMDLARPRLALVEDALERFAIDCGRYPDDSEGLEVLLVMPDDLEGKWNGPYLKRSLLLDPWENPIVYIAEGEINPGSYDLVSLGADGEDGGEGPNEDVVND